jgi:hypothetical protein
MANGPNLDREPATTGPLPCGLTCLGPAPGHGWPGQLTPSGALSACLGRSPRPGQPQWAVSVRSSAAVSRYRLHVGHLLWTGNPLEKFSCVGITLEVSRHGGAEGWWHDGALTRRWGSGRWRWPTRVPRAQRSRGELRSKEKWWECGGGRSTPIMGFGNGSGSDF